MANNFFDTSALGKHYHVEVGSPKVEAILQEVGAIAEGLTVVDPEQP